MKPITDPEVNGGDRTERKAVASRIRSKLAAQYCEKLTESQKAG